MNTNKTIKLIPLKIIILYLICLPYCPYGKTIDTIKGLHNDSKDLEKKSQRLPTFARSKSPDNAQIMRIPVSTYNDADDVIHIIEPPQHFQEMKRRNRQQYNAQPLNNTFGTRNMPQRASSVIIKNPVFQVAPKKVKEHTPAIAKVEKTDMFGQLQRNSRRKPAIATVKLDDLLTQETKMRADSHLPQESQFPLEILASVRKTERQFHQQQRPPFAKQRVKTHKTHTVIMERGYEQSRYKNGQENRAGGLKAKRMRRDLSGIVDETQKSTSSSIEQGSQLLARLDALLQYATRFVPDDNDTATHNNVLNELRQRFQNEYEPKQLIGEIEPTVRPMAPERQLYEIIESSLNATDMIMQELIQKRAASGSTEAYLGNKCDLPTTHIRLSDASAMQQLQSKIDCMRLQLSSMRESSTPISTTETTTTKPTISSKASSRRNRRFGQRTHVRMSVTTPTTKLPVTTTPNISSLHRLRGRGKSQDEKPLNASGRSDTFPFISNKPKSSTAQLLTGMSNVSAAAAVLLYDDVMTNIRNMLESKNLKVIPKAKSIDHVDKEAAIAIDFIEASAGSPSTLNVDATMQDSNYFRDLSRYLSDLQQIVMGLPQMQTQLSDSSNSRSGNSVDSQADWYLINEDGKISETPFDVQLQPTTVIFHRFPDIPNAAIFLRNHTASDATPQQENAYEIF